LTIISDGTSCGPEFNEDSEYLVFGYEDNQIMVVDQCDLFDLAEASEVLSELGPGVEPTDEPPPTPTKPPITLEAPQEDQDAAMMPEFDPAIGVVLLAVIGLLVLSLVVVMRRGGKA
jgi:hypothetical protein